MYTPNPNSHVHADESSLSLACGWLEIQSRRRTTLLATDVDEYHLKAILRKRDHRENVDCSESVVQFVWKRFGTELNNHFDSSCLLEKHEE